MSYEDLNNIPVSKVQLRIKLSNILDKDVLSKSDPQVIVYSRNSVSAKWLEIGRTELIMNNLNPEFATPIEIDYFFEEEQQLRFYAMDVDDFRATSIEKNDFLGEYVTTLARIVNAPNKRIKGRLQKVSRGEIVITAEEVVESKKVMIYKFSARKLDKKDFFGKSDPFFAVYRHNGDPKNKDSLLLTYESEVIRNTLNPSWKKNEVKISKICNCNVDEPLIFKIFDWNKNGSRDYIGEFETTIADLSSNVIKEISIINVYKKAKKGKSYRNSGVFVIESCEVKEDYSFLDYLSGRTNFNLTIAVDFTASNKNPNDPTSLHYRNPRQYNEYQDAIYSVARILEVYSKDKQFPMYGFGAKLPNGLVSHCFALNGKENTPNVFGIEGIMSSYNMALSNVILYGPTNFSPIIKKVIEKCELLENESKGSNYHVLLIITDGKISDREETIRSIIKASFLPISIIIVGVGNDDFETMNELDADNVPLRDGRTVMNRDIVQFVPYRDYKNKTMLAKAVLAEIPDQFISHMKENHIEPNINTDIKANQSFVSEFTPAFDRTNSFIGQSPSIIDPNNSFTASPTMSPTINASRPNPNASFYNHNPVQPNYSFMSNTSQVYPSPQSFAAQPYGQYPQQPIPPPPQYGQYPMYPQQYGAYPQYQQPPYAQQYPVATTTTQPVMPPSSQATK